MIRRNGGSGYPYKAVTRAGRRNAAPPVLVNLARRSADVPLPVAGGDGG
jgi:hypothetical protein